MDGRAFLRAARRLLTAANEESWRTAAGRAYYALLHEGRAALERWGFVAPPRESIHFFVRRKLNFAAEPDLKQVGKTLDLLGGLRNEADYRLSTPGRFGAERDTVDAVEDAEDMVALLDAIEADPARRAAAVAAVAATGP